MRSLAEAAPFRRVRKGIERAFRAALVLALLTAIYLSLTSMNERPSASASGGESTVRSALREWSTSSSPRSAALRFDSTPSAVTRAWAASLAGTGTKLKWSASLAPMGISVEPIPDPKSVSRVFLAAPARTTLTLRDSLGVIDTLAVRSGGASVGALILHGSARVSAGRSAASSARQDSLVVRPVLVIGRAGWEGKFIVTALEEYGWRVNARLGVSPGNEATQGAVAVPIDTANYSAVLVLDSSAARYAPAVLRYVRAGGGLIAFGEGGSIASLQAILPAGVGSSSPPGEFNSAKPRDALSLRSLSNVKRDAIALEKRGGRIAIAARRAGNGRVVQVGYEDTWRWRMAGAGDAVEDHRNWISSVVSSAAYAPRIALAPVNSDPAPTAELFGALGAPSSGSDSTRPLDERAVLLALFALALAVLILETASRRLDGRP